jgi:two-component system response regulator AdeR
MEKERMPTAPHSVSEPGLAPAAPATGALVLIAEDAPEIADILAAYLARSGMRSVHASDGVRALELHLAHKPDLVLLDIQMPQLNGWQVLNRQRDQTPVIMLTALDQDVDKLTGLRIGADDYVVKPFNPAEVVARVEAVLRRSQPVVSAMTGASCVSRPS